MSRRCLHCTSEIIPPHPPLEAPLPLLVAVHAGYCTSMCQGNAAVIAVATRTAWWMAHDPAAYPALPRAPKITEVARALTIGEVNLLRLGFDIGEAVVLASDDAEPGLYEAALRGAIRPGMMPR